MEPGIRFRRALWGAVIFLAFIGAAVAVRRIAYLGPILARGIRRQQSHRVLEPRSL
jgi:hypothetical protein